MALDHNPLQAKQTGTIVPAVVNTSLEVPKHRNRENRDQLGQNVAPKLLTQERTEHLSQSLGSLERHVADKAIAHDYDGIQHDYTKKQGLVWQEVFLPEYAPQEWQDREKLWNAVEEVETAKDSRLAREFVVALPIELNREERIELLQELIREQFVAD